MENQPSQQEKPQALTLPRIPPKPDPDLPNHDPIGEEMIDVGLNPNEVATPAYLRARRLAVQGKLKTLGELRQAALGMSAQMGGR